TSLAGRRPTRERWSALLDPTASVNPDSEAFRLGMVESWLTEAYFRIGELAASAGHAEHALRHFGVHVPSRTVPLLLDTFRPAVRRRLQMTFGVRCAGPARARRVATEIARVQARFAEACWFSGRMLPLFAATLRQINVCQPAGPELELAFAYSILAS